jgi:hypothetical protein
MCTRVQTPKALPGRTSSPFYSLRHTQRIRHNATHKPSTPRHDRKSNSHRYSTVSSSARAYSHHARHYDPHPFDIAVAHPLPYPARRLRYPCTVLTARVPRLHRTGGATRHLPRRDFDCRIVGCCMYTTNLSSISSS